MNNTNDVINTTKQNNNIILSKFIKLNNTTVLSNKTKLSMKSKLIYITNNMYFGFDNSILVLALYKFDNL